MNDLSSTGFGPIDVAVIPPKSGGWEEILEKSEQARLERERPGRSMSSAERKAIPLCTGVIDYFPAALAAVARLSKSGNDKHNPGEPLHWTRQKSADHADCIARHLVDRGAVDPDTGMSHTVMVAWRALALLQVEEEERGAPVARGAVT